MYSFAAAGYFQHASAPPVGRFCLSFFSKVHKAGCELTSYLAHRNTGTVGLTENSTSNGGGEVPVLPACFESYTLSRGALTGAPEKLTSQSVNFLRGLKKELHAGKGHLGDKVSF